MPDIAGPGPGGVGTLPPQMPTEQPGGIQAPGAGAPMGGPMSTPQPKMGAEVKAKASVEVAMKVLSMACSAFDPSGQEAHALRKALDGLAKAFGAGQHDAKDLVPTEIAQLMQGMKPPAGMPQGGPPGAPPPGAHPPGPGGPPMGA
jgi:hypothetical protein